MSDATLIAQASHQRVSVIGNAATCGPVNGGQSVGGVAHFIIVSPHSLHLRLGGPSRHDALRQPRLEVGGGRVVLTSRIGSDAVATLDQLVERAKITAVPFDEPLADAAFEAFKKFGKGRGHPAQLNILDCVAYALATSRNVPLLFKDADFARTDVVSFLDQPIL